MWKTVILRHQKTIQMASLISKTLILLTLKQTIKVRSKRKKILMIKIYKISLGQKQSQSNKMTKKTVRR